MSGNDRRDWRCPACNRKFSIPADADPNLCPECVQTAGNTARPVRTAPAERPAMIATPRVKPVAAMPVPVFDAEPEARSLRKLARRPRGLPKSVIVIGAILGAMGVCLSVMLYSGSAEFAAGGMVLAMTVLLGTLMVLFYFLPTIVAVSRNHHSSSAIAVLNIFLGWTFIGYVAALVWSFTAVYRFDDRGNLYVRSGEYD